MKRMAVLHTFTASGYAVVVPAENVPELKRKLNMHFAYTEVLGDCTYEHYDVLGVFTRGLREAI